MNKRKLQVYLLYLPGQSLAENEKYFQTPFCLEASVWEKAMRTDASANPGESKNLENCESVIIKSEKSSSQTLIHPKTKSSNEPCRL